VIDSLQFTTEHYIQQAAMDSDAQPAFFWGVGEEKFSGENILGNTWGCSEVNV